MIECPWCSNQVILDGTICPVCKHEVMPEHLEINATDQDQSENHSDIHLLDLGKETIIANRYSCVKCRHTECDIDEIATTGAGLSKLFNVQYHHYLFVSCTQCGYVEIYNPMYLSQLTGGNHVNEED